jgi:hypothetical protein
MSTQQNDSELPRVIGLCPEPTHAREFYMPHGGACPWCDNELVVYTAAALTGRDAAMDDKKMVPVDDVVTWLDEKTTENGHLGTLYTAQEVIQGVRDAFVRRFDANALTSKGEQ